MPVARVRASSPTAMPARIPPTIHLRDLRAEYLAPRYKVLNVPPLLSLEVRARAHQRLSGRRLDVIVTHAPPLGCGDRQDPEHRGFAPFDRLISNLAPRVLIHGQPAMRAGARYSSYWGSLPLFVLMEALSYHPT